MIKSILVHLNDSSSCNTRLRLAKQLSTKFAAKVSGIHFSAATFALDNEPVRQREKVTNVTDINGATGADHADKVGQEQYNIEQKLADLFPSQSLPNWETFIGKNGHDLIANCIYHDLVILSSNLNVSNLLSKLNSAIVSVATESGCPIVVIPPNYECELTYTHPVIAWNSGKAVARAVSDALPFLQEAKEVTVYTDTSAASNSGRRPKGLQKLAEYLSLHDVNHNIVSTKIAEDNYSTNLLKRISTDNHDLVVMGAYDRSNVRELMLGSTTRKLIQSAKVPILISH